MSRAAAAGPWAALALLAASACGRAGAAGEAPWVEGARVRVSPAGVGAVYLTLHNPGPREDRLLSVRAEGAARVELHEVVAEGSFLRMRARPEGFVLPARGALQLRTGGKHLMVYGLEPTRAALPLELTLARGGTLRVSAPVRSALDEAP